MNVLNGQTETFETTPVEVELESLDGNVKTTISTFTAERVRKHESYQLGKVHPFERDTVSKSWHPTNSGFVNWSSRMFEVNPGNQ